MSNHYQGMGMQLLNRCFNDLYDNDNRTCHVVHSKLPPTSDPMSVESRDGARRSLSIQSLIVLASAQKVCTYSTSKVLTIVLKSDSVLAYWRTVSVILKRVMAD